MQASISPTLPLLLFFIFSFCLSNNGVHAFGAGNIPSYAFVEGKAFRHGDIEDTLADLIKKGVGGFALSSLIGKGPKFGGLDIKRVYFGNWLRDYSQAVDISTLKKVNLQTILNLVMVLGFMANGYATGEFEVTPERLGAYLPTEHIDNPKGYGEGEDPRQYDPRLRGPVHVHIIFLPITYPTHLYHSCQPDELAIDPQTGMKNYIANENGHWDTSKALVRRVLQQCIYLGRKYKSSGDNADQYEAFRLLGQALHTLEDFSAHSNFCELALVSMGHTNVFVHVGDAVRVRAHNGKMVAPIVTGTFGSSDFIYSLLGEATDHISEASVTELNKEFDRARSKPNSSSDMLRDAFLKLPGGSGDKMGRDMEGIQRMRAGIERGNKRPGDMSPQELHSVLWQVLSFRDSVMKSISGTLEKIPGLNSVIEKIQDSISVFVFTTLEPFLRPIMQTATAGLSSASSEVIDNHDQYEVFNDPYASDPTHSFLSKDHFNLILNEPAGNIAKLILKHTVNLVTKAWDDSSLNVNQVTDEALQCLFHPDFQQSSSVIQRDMLEYMRSWVQNLGHNQHAILARLTKESVRAQDNTRLAADGSAPASHAQAQQGIQGLVHGIPGATQMQGLMNMVGGSAGTGREGGQSSGQPGSYYSRPETIASYGTVQSTSSSYAPPSAPLAPSAAYAPSGYPSARPTSGYPPPSTFPPAGDYSMSHRSRIGDYSQPCGPPPDGFGPGGFPDEHRGTHGHEFPEAPVYGGRHGQHAFDDDYRRGDGDQQQASFPSPGGHPPRNDPYDNRW
ncbi:heterokaryon incompatibility protein Het-C-domain-containing protein [Suillus subalutaceus]|uniref:heterokaryon incompatibility protein Het-C-domain-containing protein n=1 Tax=Suillus subalutaceus TaxID=48586 RepID=UPI001B86F25B|nr:heterokaryon incompatibility protein Het-C-domain-containing protein [Suillus subalutaceus]KAG1862734.1 heterokaryon incompatibility protein Het-C-domain-containing protein [Suillus subalutaceus]